MTISARIAAAACLLAMFGGVGSARAQLFPWRGLADGFSVGATGPCVDGCGSCGSRRCGDGDFCREDWWACFDDACESWCGPPELRWGIDEDWCDNGCSRGSAGFWAGDLVNPCDDGNLWRVKQDALLLRRSTAEPLDILFSPLPVLDVADLHFDYEAGPKFSIARRVGCNQELELEYFSIDGWSSSAVRDGDPLIIFPPGVFVSTQFAVEYDSRLYSTELNSRHRMGGGFDLLLGYRYVELQEDFDVTGLPMPPQNLIPHYDTHTSNQMHGFQLGAILRPRPTRLFGRDDLLSWEGFLKAGVFGNHARQRTFRIGNLGIPRTASDHTDHVAFLGEVGLTAILHLSDFISFRAGYQAMWIEGVALAPDQIPYTTVGPLSLASANLDMHGGLLYHGAHFGLEAQW